MDSEGRRERLNDFFESAVLGLSIVGADGRVVDANRVELERLGVARTECVGRAWSDFHVEPSRAALLLARLAAGETLRGELVRLRETSGAERSVVLDANARFEAGAFVAARCITRDADRELDVDRQDTERRIVAAAEAVQRRIGRDLHDGLGQLLIGAAFYARELWGKAPDSLRAPVARLVELLNESTSRVQNIARGLSPVRLGERPLRAALESLAATAESTGGLSCLVEVAPAAQDLSEAEGAEVCLIVQEAMRNAIRHGGAREIRVELRPDGERMVLSIADDGSGIGAAAPQGVGLESMRARARALGGTLGVERRASGGTLVRCTWPARSASAPSAGADRRGPSSPPG